MTPRRPSSTEVDETAEQFFGSLEVILYVLLAFVATPILYFVSTTIFI